MSVAWFYSQLNITASAMLQCGRRLAGLAGTASRQQLVSLGGASTRLYHENVGPICRIYLLLLGDVFQAQCVFAVVVSLNAYLPIPPAESWCAKSSGIVHDACIVRAGD